MKKSLHIMLIAMLVYVLFSFTSVYAASTIPMVAVTYRLENSGHYKSLKGTTFTSDEDSIDFTYRRTVNNVEKVYTASFIKNGNVFSYTRSGAKTGEDAYYQALLDDVAVDAMFFAVGEASAMPTQTLTDMAKDYSKYTLAKYGFEVTTYDYKGTIDGKAVSMKAIDTFKIDAKNITATGISDLVIEDEEETEVELQPETPIEKKNTIKSLILGIILVAVGVLLVILAIKTKKTMTSKKATVKKVDTKKTTTKKTK